MDNLTNIMYFPLGLHLKATSLVIYGRLSYCLIAQTLKNIFYIYNPTKKTIWMQKIIKPMNYCKSDSLGGV